MDLSVVITTRDEPYLKQTIESIKRSCGADDPEIIVVCDGPQVKRPARMKGVRYFEPFESAQGCQRARDYGIGEATCSTVVVVDAHMDFADGLFAEYSAYLTENPRYILGARCPGLDVHRWEKQPHNCYGSHVIWIDGKNPLAVKWRYDPDRGPMACVLGACYGMNREWYMDGLRRPWQFGTGWGCDEQILTIVNWLCGGEARTLNMEAPHWFRVQNEVPFTMTAADTAGVFANRIKMANMLPMTEQWRQELVGAVWKDGPAATQARLVMNNLSVTAEGIVHYRTFLEGQERTFEQWRKLYCSDGNPNDDKSLWPTPDATGMVEPGSDYAAPLFTPEPEEEKPREKAERQFRPAVVDKGVPCPQCSHAFDHHITNTYPNGNRRRVCAKCGYIFITIRSREEV